MARTDLAAAGIKTPKGPSPGTVNAGDLHCTFQASDSANGNQYVPAAGDILLVRNVHASSARTVTLTSQPDERKRTGHITAYSLAAGEQMAFHYGDMGGWIDPATGKIYLDSSAVDIQYFVLRRPN